MLDAIPDEQDVSKLRADIIAGDLDSIRPDVQHIFEGLGSQVIDLSDDQDTTDLQKCLSQLEQHFSAEQLASATVVAAGQLRLHFCTGITLYMTSRTNNNSSSLWDHVVHMHAG